MDNRKNNKITSIVFLLLLATLIFITGCGGNSGSYITPLSIAPYTSGKTGVLKGKLYARVMPGEYFGIYEESEDTGENPVFKETDDDVTEYYSKVKGVIRIANKKYIYNPEVDMNFISLIYLQVFNQ